MAIYNGNKLVRKLHVGGQRVRAVYAGAEKVWPNIVRVEQGEEYGEWTYDDPVRRRTVTPWEQDVYCDDTLGDRRTGTPYTQEERAQESNGWDGVTFWNGSCSTDYYYVDYAKNRTVFTYPDGVIRYSDYYNGFSRSRRIDGQCGWVRSTVVVTDWANTGALCNAAGTVGGYDCDGTYQVQYYQQKRTLEECYPDGSGGINRRDEYRAGSMASRQQVDGYCGYTSTTRISITLSDSTYNSGISDGDFYVTIYTTSGSMLRTEDLKLGSNTIYLSQGEAIYKITGLIYNSGYYESRFQVIWDGITKWNNEVPNDDSLTCEFSVSLKYSDGDSSHNLELDERG